MDVDKILVEHPIIRNMENYEEIFWLNDKVGQEAELPFNKSDIDEAEARLLRFAPYIAKAFPETAETKGIIESPLIEIENMKAALEKEADKEILGRLFIKCDSHLPVSGSIKARGGIYEILKLAEKIAIEKGMLKYEDNY